MSIRANWKRNREEFKKLDKKYRVVFEGHKSKAPKKYRGSNYSTKYVHDIFGKRVALTVKKKK